MLAPSEEGRDAVSGHHTHDPGSEQTGARVAGLPLKIQNPHAGVVVVHQMALRRLADQLLPNRLQNRGRFRDQLPLRRRGQWYPQMALQPLHPVKRNTAAVLQQANHAHGAGVVFFRAHPRRRRRGEHLSTQVAAQRFQFVNSRFNRRLPDDPDQTPRLVQRVHLSLLALRAVIRPLQRRVCHAHFPRALIRPWTVTAVSLLAGCACSFGATGSALAFRLRFLRSGRIQYLPGLLGRSVRRQQLAQFPDSGVLIRQHPSQDAQRGHRRLQFPLPFRRQGALSGAVHQLLQLLNAYIDRFDSLRHWDYSLGGCAFKSCASRMESTWSRRRNWRANGNASTCLTGRLGRCVGSSLPRPVVEPTTIQFAAR